jgi:hypothetical protein
MIQQTGERDGSNHDRPAADSDDSDDREPRDDRDSSRDAGDAEAAGSIEEREAVARDDDGTWDPDS